LSLDIEVQESGAFSGELIDARRRRAAEDAAAVAAYIALAEVVNDD
jgi:hypothetical protein